MRISCCDRCREALEGSYVLTEVGEARRMGTCEFILPQHRALLTVYEAQPKRRSGSRRDARGDANYGRRDTRARHKEPWRDF